MKFHCHGKAIQNHLITSRHFPLNIVSIPPDNCESASYAAIPVPCPGGNRDGVEGDEVNSAFHPTPRRRQSKNTLRGGREKGKNAKNRRQNKFLLSPITIEQLQIE